MKPLLSWVEHKSGKLGEATHRDKLVECLFSQKTKESLFHFSSSAADRPVRLHATSMHGLGQSAASLEAPLSLDFLFYREGTFGGDFEGTA
jgi:hypothetical protein